MRALALVAATSVVSACTGGARVERRVPPPQATVAVTAPSTSSSLASPPLPATIAPIAPSTPPPKPRTEARASGDWGTAFAPADVRGETPPLVYLHGMWASPEDSCSFFEEAAMATGVLICPRGDRPAREGGGWGMQLGSARKNVDAAFEAARALSGEVTIASRGGVLMGFSSGARFAVQLALAEEGRWDGLVLMSMQLHLSAPALKKAGVRRVLLATSEDDGSFGSLRANAQALQAAGLPAKFVSFGRVGHHFPPDMAKRMRDAVDWIRSDR